MKKNSQSEMIKEAKQEFKEVVFEFLLPLLDYCGEIRIIDNQTKNKSLVEFVKDGNIMRFFPCICKKEHLSPYYCEVTTSYSYLNSPIIKCIGTILREILKVLEYNCFGGGIKKQRNYGTKKNKSLTYKKKTIQLAFEMGMCCWLTGSDPDAIVLYSIIYKMQNWSSKTYEGHNVTFGLVVDFNQEKTGEKVNFVEYLDENSSAVFSDGVFTGIRLDKNGDLDSFFINNSKITDEERNRLLVPFKFENIAVHCKDKAIGVITLENGEILIIKNQSLVFAKRGIKWVLFDWTRVMNSFIPYFTAESEKDKKIKYIYKTILDVSFSHTGGCLAIVSPDTINSEINAIIKDRFGNEIDGDYADTEKKKIEIKIKIVRGLLGYKDDSRCSFYDVNHPLLKEILSLDGATTISTKGLFYCAGSIVSVPGGSSGGGRKAAAMNLANLGIGIKISEDGYIEAYGKNKDYCSGGDKTKLLFCI